MTVAVVVFTRDLRVRDHPALAAGSRADLLVPLFVVDDRLVWEFHRSPNRLQFLVDSLADLDAGLRRLGGALVVRRGDWLDEVAKVVEASGANIVHVSADVSSFAQARLDALQARGERQGFAVAAHPGVTVVPPDELRTGSGTAYQVFTPYYRRWLAAPWRTLATRPRAITLPGGVAPGVVPALSTLTDLPPAPDVMRGGETAALARLKRWTGHDLARYPEMHNALPDDATSRCSPYLHFGCLSSLEVATRLRDRHGGEAFVRQLCWRDFFHQLLASRPELGWEDMRGRGVPAGTDDATFDAWRHGNTGYPLVDAGMRQLQREGFVHNRARMVVASFLTKDLDTAWQRGARHFMELLVDGDVANNQLNWQWVAGTGTDANPHRIFNPIRQSERFDPDGVYIRRYVPELASVAATLIHDPPSSERARVGYPDKLVDHADAIAAYRARLS